MDGRVFGARILDQMLKIEARTEHIVHAGKADPPFAGVDFRHLSQRGLAVVVCCKFTRTR